MTNPIYTTLPDFEAEARQRGFDEVLERVWAPGIELGTHTHAFAVWAQVASGEFWLTAAGSTQHFGSGEQFSLDADVPHAERYGHDGATVWVARRHNR